MATTRHSLAQFEGTGALFLGGQLTAAGVAGNVIQISSTTGLTGPLLENADAQVVRNSAGNYTLTINPFKGPLGAVCYSITARTTATNVNCVGVDVSTAYTNDSLALTIACFVTSNGTKIDSDVQFLIFAF